MLGSPPSSWLIKRWETVLLTCTGCVMEKSDNNNTYDTCNHLFHNEITIVIISVSINSNGQKKFNGALSVLMNSFIFTRKSINS